MMRGAIQPDAPRMSFRGEQWFISAGGGRDAQRQGKPLTAAPFAAYTNEGRAWRLGWVCASRGEDVTMRYALRQPRQGWVSNDYTAEAIVDFRHYASDASIAPDMRDAAREMLVLVERNARASRGGR